MRAAKKLMMLAAVGAVLPATIVCEVPDVDGIVFVEQRDEPDFWDYVFGDYDRHDHSYYYDEYYYEDYDDDGFFFEFDWWS